MVRNKNSRSRWVYVGLGMILGFFCFIAGYGIAFQAQEWGWGMALLLCFIVIGQNTALLISTIQTIIYDPTTFLSLGVPLILFLVIIAFCCFATLELLYTKERYA